MGVRAAPRINTSDFASGMAYLFYTAMAGSADFRFRIAGFGRCVLKSIMPWPPRLRPMPWLVIALAGALAYGLTLYLFAPGYMSSDSGVQLVQARTLNLRDDHPILMALLWHCTDRLLPGPLGMFVLASGLYWAGLSGFFTAVRGAVALRAAGLFAVGFFPPAFIVVPAIWKDTLMQAALVAALAALVVPTRRAAVLRHVLAMVFFLVAIGVRHNALAAVWPLLAFALLRLHGLAGRPAWVRLGLASVVSVALTLGLTLVLKQALTPLAEQRNFWQKAASYDLAGMSLQTGKLLIEPGSGLLVPGAGLDDIRDLYRDGLYGPRLYYCKPFQGNACAQLFRWLTETRALGHLSRNWRRAIVEHPGAYLAHRKNQTLSLLGWRDGPTENFYLGSAPHHRLARDYPPRPHTVSLLRWLDARLPGLMFRPWLYLLVSIVLLPLAVFRWLRAGTVLPLLLLLSGLCYALSTFIGAVTTDYRYMVWSNLSTVLAVVSFWGPASECVGKRRKALGERFDKQSG